jgi:hypothetical protein
MEYQHKQSVGRVISRAGANAPRPQAGQNGSRLVSGLEHPIHTIEEGDSGTSWLSASGLSADFELLDILVEAEGTVSSSAQTY